jgi:hypothetical protein
MQLRHQVAQMWAKQRLLLIEQGAPSRQISEMGKAYYSGVLDTLCLMHDQISELPMDAGALVIGSMVAECAAFLKSATPQG